MARQVHEALLFTTEHVPCPKQGLGTSQGLTEKEKTQFLFVFILQDYTYSRGSSHIHTLPCQRPSETLDKILEMIIS